jgi:putative ABC transport system permease protein
VASAEYFDAMGIPLIRGRLFDEGDSADAPHAAVISASLAETRWPGEDPIGKLIQFGNMDFELRPFTIVGIVGDVQEYGIGTQEQPTFYGDHRQRPRTVWDFHLAIQGDFDPGAVISAARRIVGDLNPEVPTTFQPLEELVSVSLGDRRFVLLLLSVFGVLALLLATTGVYGVMAYLAMQRTSEAGIRFALGANNGDVMRLLVRRGAMFAIVGVSVGLVAALGLSRLLGNMLYGVGAADPTTLVTAVVVTFLTALMASSIPAYRVSRLNVVEALRHE